MKDSSKKVLWRVLGIVFTVIAVACVVIFLLLLKGCPEDKIDKNPGWETADVITLPSGGDITVEVPEPEPEPDLPIITGELTSEVKSKYAVDFDAMLDINPDIHAWINLPGTPIDYPVLQSPISDLYYERRDHNGDYSVTGCIFTQYYNSLDFSDRNTVLYGHYMLDGRFFGTLHNYKDPEFFKNNRYVYITIPGHVLVYEVFAAYETDDRHVLTLCNYYDDEEYSEYLQSCLNPSTMVRTIKEGVELTSDDRIITLSTCTSYYTYTNRRYLVQGVLVADVETD